MTPVLIVRDEEEYLPGALDSLLEAGKVFATPCVYDTGSVDATRAIAAAAGANVQDGYWDDDFARARNAANAMARTRWIMWIDADERLVVSPELLRRAIGEADRRGLEALVIDVLDVRDGRAVNRAPSMRFFRPDAARFRNRIHEGVVAAGGLVPRASRLDTDVAHFRHLTYGIPARDAARTSRNARIAEAEVSAARTAGHVEVLCEALVNRGRAALAIGERRSAERDWREARGLATESAFALYAGELLAELYVEEGRLPEAATLVRSLAREGSEPSMTAWLTAQALAKADLHEQVVAALADPAPPLTALGERLSIAPVLQARMLAAARTDHFDIALSDAVMLIAAHGVHGFARLTLLLWGQRSPEDLAALLASTPGVDAPTVAAEFRSVGGVGIEVADRVTRCAQSAPTTTSRPA